MFKTIVILILFLAGTTVLNANQDSTIDAKIEKTEKVDQKKGSSKNSQKKD